MLAELGPSNLEKTDQSGARIASKETPLRSCLQHQDNVSLFWIPLLPLQDRPNHRLCDLHSPIE